MWKMSGRQHDGDRIECDLLIKEQEQQNETE